MPSANIPQKKLPIGLQSFQKIQNENYYYVDKTKHLHQLIDQGVYYFLSRPRRFGKSLLIDTLHCLFESQKSLFEGLYIEDKWDWETKFPVIRFSFGDGVSQSRAELDKRISQQLQDNRTRLGLAPSTALDIPGQFRHLLMDATNHHGQNAVVLIDEYDKPMLDNLSNSAAAAANREGLKNLYSVIKDADEFIKFCLLTGVSKFSKVSLFSGLNNLTDITLDSDFSDICGYTDEDIDHIFAPELNGLDRDQIRAWYNGYRWLGKAVYNPFDVLLLFRNRTFKPYWFESATPSFLVETLREREVTTPQLSQLMTDHELLGHFDIGNIGTEALLFQTGYLTITASHEPIPGIWSYTLDYPNLEVENSLNKALLMGLGVSHNFVSRNRLTLLQALENHDAHALERHLKGLFASIPHDWYRNNPIQNYEGHYASVFYSHFAAIGLHVQVEDASVNGQVDMMISLDAHSTKSLSKQAFIFEFKVVENAPTSAALQQIIDRRYADKYRASHNQVWGVGIEFSKQQRQIVGFDMQQLADSQ